MRFIIVIILTLLGIILGWILKWLKARIKLVASEKIAARKLQEVLDAAESSRREMLQEGDNQLRSERELIKEEIRERRKELEKLDGQLKIRSGFLNERESSLVKMKNSATAHEQELKNYESRVSGFRVQFQEKLEKISGSTRKEIKDQIVQNLINQEKRDAQHVIDRMEEQTRRNPEAHGSEILLSAMQRLPISQSIEHSTVLGAPTQDMISRLINREGRFIRILESLLEVELYVEDTLAGFTLSSPDPLKREIAKATMDRLFKEGRINPARIEETVRFITREVNRTMIGEARKILQDLNLGNFPKDAVNALGRLLYRYSYGQNMLYHSKEVALIASMLAIELKADPKIAKRGGLLHDIGKGFAIDGKPHVEIGVEFATKWGEHPMVINCIASHHDDEEPQCMEAVIVKIADAISGARPGARRETIAGYTERVENLEKIAEDFQYVDKAFAIYAGRELRIIVNSEKANDEKTASLGKEIVKKIEEELSYPGRIKVTVIREMKTSTYTR